MVVGVSRYTAERSQMVGYTQEPRSVVRWQLKKRTYPLENRCATFPGNDGLIRVVDLRTLFGSPSETCD